MKGSLSPNQFNLSKFIFCLFDSSSYKIVTQSFYGYDKFVSKPFLDLTDKNWDMFIKTIVLSEKDPFNYIHSSISIHKKING